MATVNTRTRVLSCLGLCVHGFARFAVFMSNFAELVSILRTANRLELVPALAKHAITSLTKLRTLGLTQFVNLCLEANIPSDTVEAAGHWLQGHELKHRHRPDRAITQTNFFESKRKDLPLGRPVVVSKRSKLQIALEVAQDPVRYRSETDKFLKDQWAASSIGPKESLRHTWCDFATAGGLEPLPVTVELVQHMGTLFKSAEYCSAQNYFNEATAKHLSETGFPVSVLIRKSIKSALRSIRRGMASTTQKRVARCLCQHACSPGVVS